MGQSLRREKGPGGTRFGNLLKIPNCEYKIRYENECLFCIKEVMATNYKKVGRYCKHHRIHENHIFTN